MSFFVVNPVEIITLKIQKLETVSFLREFCLLRLRCDRFYSFLEHVHCGLIKIHLMNNKHRKMQHECFENKMYIKIKAIYFLNDLFKIATDRWQTNPLNLNLSSYFRDIDSYQAIVRFKSILLFIRLRFKK